MANKKSFLSKVVLTISIILLIFIGSCFFLSGQKKTDVENLLDRGVNLAREEKYLEAVNIWEKALAISPKEERAKEYIRKAKGRIEAQAHLLEAEKLMNEGSYTEAVDELKAALKIHPENEKAQLCLKKAGDKLAQNQRLEQASDLINKGGYAEAIKGLEDIGEGESIYPQAQKLLANAYFQLGLSYYSQAMHEQAINAWQKALKADSSHTQASQYLSKLKWRKEIKQKSDRMKRQADIADLRLAEAIRFAESARNNMATAQWSMAIADWDEVLTTVPAKEDSLHKEAVEGRRLAKEMLDNEILNIEMLNNEIKLCYERGEELLSKGERLAAKEEFKQVLVLSKNSLYSSKAKEQLEKIANQIQLETAKFYEQGVTYFNGGDFKSALSEFRGVLSLSSKYKDTKEMINQCIKELKRQAKELYIQGVIAEDIDQYEFAKKKWQKVITTAPDENDEYYQKAKEKLTE